MMLNDSGSLLSASSTEDVQDGVPSLWVLTESGCYLIPDIDRILSMFSKISNSDCSKTSVIRIKFGTHRIQRMEPIYELFYNCLYV